MNWMDLLRMSGSSLKRRKLRTFLTVLGVVIGTTSIVVMISLGLGMQESLYRQVEQSGGLTTITVKGAEAGAAMMYSDMGAQEESKKYVTDQTVNQLKKIDHVSLATPAYEMTATVLKGRYEGWAQIIAMTPEALESMNIELGEGELPKANSGRLDMVYGNMMLTQFTEKGTNKGYYETGELPDIDLMKDSLFLILDQDAYYSNQEQGAGGNEGSGDAGRNAEGGLPTAKKVEKHVVRASGLVAGGPEEYNVNSYNAYCDLETLKQMLKKEFSGKVIPGQPTRKSGKPYKEFCYTSAQVKVDDIENVEAVSAAIQEMGFNVETNAEFLESMKSQFAIVQAVLGGIGAISLLVAAIGIANTMMMSIYERTKEIGVIKVLGCSLKNIKQMFLLEAAFIGLLGGVVGNIFSVMMSAIINIITGHGSLMGLDGNISYIPWWLVLLSMGFAVCVGVAAGYFPALRAMRLSPLAAIRNE